MIESTDWDAVNRMKSERKNASPDELYKIFKSIASNPKHPYHIGKFSDTVGGKSAKQKAINNIAISLGKSDKENYTTKLKNHLESQTQTEGYEEMTTQTIEQMLTHILTGDMVESASSFKEVLAEKIATKLHESKMAIAQGLFVTEARATKASKAADAARYTAGDVFDPHAPKKAAPQERHTETSDDEYAKHPLRQLKAIGDWKENTPEESFEYTANGDIDKRSLAAFEARKAGKLKIGKYSKNEGISSDLPTFKHINGEESHVHPDDANHIVHVLSHPDVKPETKQAVITALHKSKDSFNHIKNALNVGRG